VYYHFLEARRRPPIGKDDFTAWLMEDEEVNRPYIRPLRPSTSTSTTSLTCAAKWGASSPKQGRDMNATLSAYEGVVGSAVIRQLRQLGEKLAGPGSST